MARRVRTSYLNVSLTAEISPGRVTARVAFFLFLPARKIVLRRVRVRRSPARTFRVPSRLCDIKARRGKPFFFSCHFKSVLIIEAIRDGRIAAEDSESRNSEKINNYLIRVCHDVVGNGISRSTCPTDAPPAGGLAKKVTGKTAPAPDQ